MNQAVIFDLDGTLINIDGITHLFGEWEEFADATMLCPPIENMIKFARLCQKFADLWVVTAKPIRLRERTVNWLSVNGIHPDLMLMRPSHNFLSSPDLKLTLLDDYFGMAHWKQQVLFAVEDRDKMVDAWRRAGITCLQCAPSLY